MVFASKSALSVVCADYVQNRVAKIGRSFAADMGVLGNSPLTGAFDIRSDLVVIANANKKEVAARGEREDAQVESGPKLQVTSEGSHADSRMFVRTANGGLETRDGGIDAGALMIGEPSIAAIEAGTQVDHAPRFQGLSLPALRSLLIAANSRWAERSTSSAVTPYSSKGEGGPKKKFQAASWRAAEKSL